jgi:hypothetical protein
MNAYYARQMKQFPLFTAFCLGSYVLLGLVLLLTAVLQDPRGTLVLAGSYYLASRVYRVLRWTWRQIKP